MTYDEIAENIATKRWLASSQIREDVEVLRKTSIPLTLKQCYCFGVLGLAGVLGAKANPNNAILWIGLYLMFLGVCGINKHRRQDRVLTWLKTITR